MPIGPYILWLETARKSASRPRTSSARCGAACAASTTTGIPRSCAMAIIRRTRFTVPIELATYASATILVGGGFVEIDERLAMHRTRQDGKVAAHSLHVVGQRVIHRLGRHR